MMVLLLAVMMAVMVMAIFGLFATKTERVVDEVVGEVENGFHRSLDKPITQDQARKLGLRLSMNQRVGGF